MNKRQPTRSPSRSRSTDPRWPPLLAALLLLFAGAAPSAGQIAIIIDDMGYSKGHGVEALELPGELTYAFLPHAPHTRPLALEAGRKHKEVIVHLPMQSIDGSELDDGALEMDMTRHAFFQTLLADLDAVPNAVGVNNHMGSLLTRHPGAMLWLMLGLKSYGELFFIDSLTSDDSVAREMARESDVPALGRDIFLDHERDPAAIARQFDRLLSIAQQRGSALAIGHPYPETIGVLRQKLVKLQDSAVSLVTASTLVAKSKRSPRQWHASSSPSPKVAKN
jgi:uncharacterized protein